MAEEEIEYIEDFEAMDSSVQLEIFSSTELVPFLEKNEVTSRHDGTVSINDKSYEVVEIVYGENQRRLFLKYLTDDEYEGVAQQLLEGKSLYFMCESRGLIGGTLNEIKFCNNRDCKPCTVLMSKLKKDA